MKSSEAPDSRRGARPAQQTPGTRTGGVCPRRARSGVAGGGEGDPRAGRGPGPGLKRAAELPPAGGAGGNRLGGMAAARAGGRLSAKRPAAGLTNL